MEKQVITDIFLTKEAFNKYSENLRTETAAKYGMSLAEWNNAIISGSVVMPTSSQA